MGDDDPEWEDHEEYQPPEDVENLREWWANSTGQDPDDSSEAPDWENIEEYRPDERDRAPIEGPASPEMPEPGAEVGDGESIMRIDKDVEALFTGEIDKEEFDRRIEERDDDHEPEFVQRFPDEEDN